MAGPSNFEFDSSGNLKTTGGGGGGATDVNIAEIDGSPPALNNPLPVELSDGTNPLGTAGNPLRVNPTGTTTQPVSGTVAVSNFPATQPVSGTVAATQGTTPWVENTTQLGGNAIDTNSGVKGAGTQRVVLATDQPALTTPMPENLTQLAGTAIDTNSGNKSAGTQRVVLATDQPNLTTPLNVNNAQVAGTTVDTNSGNKSAGTQRVVIATDQPTLNVSASPETSTVYNGTTALTPLFANLTASSSGAQQLIAAVSSKKIRVLALALVANAAVNVKFQSHVTPTDISGLYYCAQNGGFVLPFNPAGWFQTVSGEALDINLSGAVAVGGSIVYVTV
jgi:hypothetical protein